jgi:butyryl-CoA dehydrogenase
MDLIDRPTLDFLLFDALGAGGGRDELAPVLDLAQQIARERFATVAAELDANEPRFENGAAVTPPALRRALDAYVDGGFCGMAFPPEHGGMGLPFAAAVAANLVFAAACGPAHGYPFLTAAAANMLMRFGDESQRARYLPPMVEGRWFGTMCLSETQAGSGLADIRTRAEPAGDGTYRVTGTKMWISGGEQDLTENIVHMVLARIPGGPPGVKGLSLLIVPKVVVDAGGKLGERNDVRLAGLNHKLGNRATTNTVLSFGEAGACVAELVGRPHDGMRQMFHMMNEARIGIGAAAVATAYAAYRHSLAYAQERTQGRLPGMDASAPPVPIVRHADVRRMLLRQKAIVEGGLALCLFCARMVDAARDAGPAEAADLNLLLEILTPVAKTWPSERGIEANSLAIQVFGGYGYTRDFPVERLFRDQRLNPIHEGTTGIQGLDLLGRKVRMEGGRALALLLREIRADADRAAEGALAAHAGALRAAAERIARVTAVLLAAPDPAAALANATIFLDMVGTTCIAWMHLKMAAAATGPSALHEGKRAGCAYFFRYELPATQTQAALLESVDETCLHVPVEAL